MPIILSLILKSQEGQFKCFQGPYIVFKQIQLTSLHETVNINFHKIRDGRRKFVLWLCKDVFITKQWLLF